MRSIIGYATLASANIIFTHVPLRCSSNDTTRMYAGCLRGQSCTTEGECVLAEEFRDIPLSFRKNNPVVSRDLLGPPRCGVDFGNEKCSKLSAFGSCCSASGECGSTPSHCLQENGCQSGCSFSFYSLGLNLFRPFKNYWRRPKISQEPVLHQPAQLEDKVESYPSTHEVETQDGTCGANNHGTVCGNWPSGDCCSLYGYCGNSTSHCAAGCQSGSCILAPLQEFKPKPAPAAPVPGSFQVVGKSGVAVMHAGLLPNGNVFFLDKLENYSQLMTSDGHYAMSAEYNPYTNRAVALSYSTNAFCSGGAYLADGRVIAVGGNGPLTHVNPKIGDGFRSIRTLARSSTNRYLDGQSWVESDNNKLSTARWYPSVQTMPDGSVFVVSGSLNGLDPSVPKNNNPTYEILNRDGSPRGKTIKLDILVRNQPYYMYPFMHVLPDGNVFIFVAKQAEIFNVNRISTIRQLPDLPGDYRTYPNTGGSLLLPLSSATNWKPEVLICGGGVYQDINSPTDASCGRISPLDENPTWEMDAMPEGRGMVEGTLLPDGTSVWLNGGNRGAQGFGLMAKPVLEALLYDPTKPLGQRFSTLASSGIPRLYHSCALLMLDGTILVTGSNPVEMPKLQPDAADPYVTEYRVEKYIPPYLQGSNALRRPSKIELSTRNIRADGKLFSINFTVPKGTTRAQVALYHGGFVTHSLHMGHRMLFLDIKGFKAGARRQKIMVNSPPNNNLAPPGPYVIYVVVDGIPGHGQTVNVY
ncbi:unnamed protein product [Blumeria hordei]|uniref:Chitin-binding type-1 domain-containing protein n=2 Tax=Blumeria hordei TaxID=2867405 RepID=A0A383UJJ9_BLUHO|nr:glyoxal oxidase [Blumeria hordei DH14]SZF00481.1 unnamed protein product [Blumeria hordei]